MPWTVIPPWKLVLALLVVTTLSATHWKAYTVGRDAVLARVHAEALANERAARETEYKLLEAKHKAEEDYANLKTTTHRAFTGAQSELSRLRDALSKRPAGPDSTACSRVDAATPVERELLGQCAQALTDMAGEAGRHAATLSGLQLYVRGVCLAAD